MTNSLATFQTMMNNIFQDIIIVYLNNILIFILEEYYKTVCRVIEILAKYKLFIYPEKYEFKKLCIEYLGLFILKNQVKIYSVKIAGVYD